MLFEREPLVRQHTVWSGVTNVLLLVAALGAVHLGVLGIFGFDAVDALFGHGAGVRAAYTVVGLCGLASLLALPSLRVVLRRDMRTRMHRDVAHRAHRDPSRHNDLDLPSPPLTRDANVARDLRP